VQIFELDSPTNLAAARACLGPDRVILGNVATITDMLEGNPEQVYEACGRCHKTCGKFHIVGTGCEMPPMTPDENLHAMVRYSREHGPEEFETAWIDMLGTLDPKAGTGNKIPDEEK
jgi:uroporphyrinogen-III decarboxylase